VATVGRQTKTAGAAAETSALSSHRGDGQRIRRGDERAAGRASSSIRDESGVVLILALVMMLVLTIALTTALAFTSSGSRHANRANAGQRAYALAESGVNNAVAVLQAHYPSTAQFPGDTPPGTLLPSCPPATPAAGAVSWCGTLAATSSGAQWPYQWTVQATAAVANPTGPTASAITRTASAVVPVVIAQTEPAGTGSALNWIYALGNINIGQSVTVATPVYATGNLVMSNTATISSAAGVVAVGGNVTLATQNSIGSSASRIPLAYVHGSCTYKNQQTHTPCQWDTDNIFAAGPGAGNTGGTTIPAGLLSQVPTLTCCAVPASQMGFWYRYASPGPNYPCVTSSGGTYLPQFDNDLVLNQSANGGAAVDLTPNNHPYSCTTPGGTIQWDGTSKLIIGGTVYIDGSAYISAGSGTYTGTGTIVLSGTFSMGNNTQMCANATCTPTGWNPNTTALAIVADGDGAGCCGQSQVASGDSIDIKKGAFQGVLLGNKSIDASVSGTVIVGPMVSVNGSVSTGETSTFSFPQIAFAPSGSGGITQPPPPATLLSPTQFGGG
jgi:Tfp pilus assembly protein PilX